MKSFIAKKQYVPLLFMMFTVQGCLAHAHVFIGYKIHFCVDDGGIKGVFVHWTIDRMFSAFIKKEFDNNKDNALNREEQAAIFSKAFKSLEKNDYFAVIIHNGKNLAIPEPQRFSATLDTKSDMVSYTFFLPLSIPPTQSKQKIQVYFFDPVIYVAFTVLEKDVGMQNKSNHIQASLELPTVKFVNRPTITFSKEG
ncbi:MAG: DUF1007 family protein [Chitinispirillaceae bacterium]|nr:DUF1007 family protein [Chitinispirillaceae bacterium]